MYSRESDVEHIRAMAQNGDAKAAFNLAWRYHIGHSVIADEIEAQRWYERAASSGIREAAEIQQLLQAETQRNIEFKALSEPLSPPRTHPLRWLIIAVPILGTIAFLAFLRGNIARETSPPDPIKSQATQPAPPSPLGPVIERMPESPAPPAISPEEPSPVHPTGQVTAAQDVADMEPNSFTAPPAPHARPDWDQLSRFAQKWLSDENDLATVPRRKEDSSLPLQQP